MKVNIGPICDMPGGVVEFNGRQEAPNLQTGLVFTAPVAVNGSVTNTGEGFLVKALLSFQYKVNCDRCLKEFDRAQETEVVEEFMAGPVEPGEDDLFFRFSGDIIDLKDCISENVLFALPMSFICTPECKGLCPECGKDRNIESCTCVPQQLNPQFEKLRNLLSIEGGGPNGKSKK
ncbi:MAG TPA: hypothetical protein DDW65_16520 [Firmicutes bacterium]|nr:hypothetical protein [Bacillota bacterium]